MKRLLVVAVSLAVLIASASRAAAADLENKLIHAAAIGQVDSVRTLLDRGANVNARDNKGDTALMWADNADIARLLLDKGADVNAKDDNGETSLIGAAVTGKADIARLLLDRGANVNAKDNDGYTALMWAASVPVSSADAVRVLRALLDQGADVNAKDNDGDTALHRAAMYGKADVARLLLDRGANANTKDNDGSTALMFAHKADIVRLLLHKGADVNAKDNDGYTALMYADGKVEVVRALLDRGADVNAKDNKGKTALMQSAMAGKADAVRLLLAKGADVNAKDRNGNTALYWANRGRAEDVAQILKEAAGKTDVAHAESPSVAKVPDGFVGIHWGANREQIIKAMHERGFTTKGTFFPPGKTPSPTLVFTGSFGGVNCQLEFYLEKNLFYAGRATYLGMFDTQPVQERIYRQMVSRIGQKYGPPQSDKIDARKGNDGKIYRSGKADWALGDEASSGKYEIMVILMPDGFMYFPHWNRTFGFVSIVYINVSLEEMQYLKGF